MELSEAQKHFTEKPTQELLNFIDEVALDYSRYLFTEKVLGSTYKGYCTYCQKESYLESAKPLQHNSKRKCPNCDTECIVFQRGRGRGMLVDDAYVEFFSKSICDPDVVVVGGYYIIKDYRESYTEPYFMISQTAMYIFKKDESVMFSRPYYAPVHAYEKRKSVFSLRDTSFARKRCCMSSDEMIVDALEGTYFQYALPDREKLKREFLLEYLELYIKYPYVEVLMELNCQKIIASRLAGVSTTGAINWRGKTLNKIFGLPKRDWKHFRKVRRPIETEHLLKYKKLRALDVHQKIQPIELMEFCMSYGAANGILEVLEKTSMSLPAAFKYIRKQMTVHEDYLGTEHATVRTWLDYLTECEEMNLDITGEYATPHDLYTMHQEQIERKQAIVDAELNKKIKRRVKELAAFVYEYGDYIIKPFYSAQELTREGHELKHCIARYAKRYADGETDLFSIRLKSEPHKPLYSAEVSIKNKSIIQVHGLSNRTASKEAFKAIENMLKEVEVQHKQKNKRKARKTA